MSRHLLSTLQRFVARGIADGLASGGSMFVTIPKHEESQVLEELVKLSAKHYESKGKKARTLALAAGMNWKAPKEVLRQELKIKDESRKKVLWAPQLLAESPNWPDLVIVTGVETLGPEAQKDWAIFAEQWGQYSHGHGCKKGLLFICSGTPARMPKEDLRSKVISFFREPVWGATIYPDLCGSDHPLLAKISEYPDLAEAELYHNLQEYGLERGWSRNNLEDLGVGLFARVGHAEQVRDRYLRNGLKEIIAAVEAIGATVRHPVYGLELHPAAAALLEQYQVIDRRVWRGQVAILFPLLDAIRRDISRFLQTCQPGWHTVIPHDHIDTKYGDPTSDFGHIAFTCEQMGVGRLRAIAPTIRELGNLRNELAHYRPLSVPEFYRVGQLVTEINLTLNDGELRLLHQRYAPTPLLKAATGTR